MLKVKIKLTGEIKEVTRNVAFGLVDSGQAKVWTAEDELKYQTRMMSAQKDKKYKVK